MASTGPKRHAPTVLLCRSWPTCRHLSAAMCKRQLARSALSCDGLKVTRAYSERIQASIEDTPEKEACRDALMASVQQYHRGHMPLSYEQQQYYGSALKVLPIISCNHLTKASLGNTLFIAYTATQLGAYGNNCRATTTGDAIVVEQRCFFGRQLSKKHAHTATVDTCHRYAPAKVLSTFSARSSRTSERRSTVQCACDGKCQRSSKAYSLE